MYGVGRNEVFSVVEPGPTGPNCPGLVLGWMEKEGYRNRRWKTMGASIANRSRRWDIKNKTNPMDNPLPLR